MNHKAFHDKLIDSLEEKQTGVCVGLDSRFDRIPRNMMIGASVKKTVFTFNKHIIEATADIAVSYKMNVSFYAGFGADGLEALRLTNKYLHSHHPTIPILADCKRSEMGESVLMVKQEIYDWLLFDCIMVTPWFGFDTVKDYLSDKSHGVCVYIHDSNPSAVEFQDLELKNGSRVYEVVADHVAHAWNINGNVFVESGGTYPKELKKVRTIIGQDMPLLVAGIGVQGGSTESLRGLFGTNNNRLMVNSSRGIIFAGIGKKDYFLGVKEAALSLSKALDKEKNKY